MTRYTRVALTKEGVAAIKARVKRGETLGSIAPEYGCSSAGFRKILRDRYGIVSRYSYPEREQWTQKIIACASSGKARNQAGVAQLVGCSKATVQRVLHAAEIKIVGARRRDYKHTQPREDLPRGARENDPWALYAQTATDRRWW